MRRYQVQLRYQDFVVDGDACLRRSASSRSVSRQRAISDSTEREAAHTYGQEDGGKGGVGVGRGLGHSVLPSVLANRLTGSGGGSAVSEGSRGHTPHRTTPHRTTPLMHTILQVSAAVKAAGPLDHSETTLKAASVALLRVFHEVCALHVLHCTGA